MESQPCSKPRETGCGSRLAVQWAARVRASQSGRLALASWLESLLTVWPRAGYLPSLSFNLFICKVGQMPFSHWIIESMRPEHNERYLNLNSFIFSFLYLHAIPISHTDYSHLGSRGRRGSIMKYGYISLWEKLWRYNNNHWEAIASCVTLGRSLFFSWITVKFSVWTYLA